VREPGHVTANARIRQAQVGILVKEGLEHTVDTIDPTAGFRIGI
jgi:hypothetical protein